MRGGTEGMGQELGCECEAVEMSVRTLRPENCCHFQKITVILRPALWRWMGKLAYWEFKIVLIYTV